MNSTPSFIPLVDLLRTELAGYGGLLALFDQQQGQLWRREIQPMVDTSHVLETLAAEVARHRAAREAWLAAFARQHEQPSDSTFQQMLPLFPPDQQSLLVALVKEINHLLHRVRRRARQNHTILARTVQLHRDALTVLAPRRRPRTYAANGRVGPSAGPALGLRAVG
jgi:flagellar biosynthesis/type III secretory pathway chaperone